MSVFVVLGDILIGVAQDDAVVFFAGGIFGPPGHRSPEGIRNVRQYQRYHVSLVEPESLSKRIGDIIQFGDSFLNPAACLLTHIARIVDDSGYGDWSYTRAPGYIPNGGHFPLAVIYSTR